jgi:hypothetical protein
MMSDGGWRMKDGDEGEDKSSFEFSPISNAKPPDASNH